MATVDQGVQSLHPFGFAGGIRMGATGLWHFGARNYDPTIGQWIEKDPIEYAGGTGPYLYCENDPVNCVDPDGLDGRSAATSFVYGFAGGFAGSVAVAGLLIAGGPWATAGMALTVLGLTMTAGEFMQVMTGYDLAGYRMCDSERMDRAFGLAGTLLGGALVAGSGPRGPLFGRGRLSNNTRPNGIFNRSERLRLGWFWWSGTDRNWFGFHGGPPGTPAHWHAETWVIPGPGDAPLPAPFQPRFRTKTGALVA